jgi:hypothetical protein
VRRARWIGLGLLLSAHASAQAPLPLALEWRAPAECASATAVQTELARIARVRSGFSVSPLKARAHVEQHARGYRLQLHTEQAGKTGHRQLDAPDCQTLVRAATFVLAVAFGTAVEIEGGPTPAATGAMDPAPPGSSAPPRDAVLERSAADSGRSEKPEGSAPPGAAPRGELTASAPPTAALSGGPAAAPSARWSLLAGAGLQLGLLSTAALSLDAGAELAFAQFALALRARAWPGVETSVPGGLHARYDGLAGLLQGCTTRSVAGLQLMLCAAARAAALRGRARGATQDASEVAAWYALATGIALGYPASHWLRVRIEANLALSLNRPRFVIDGIGTVHRVPLVVPDLGVVILLTP